MDKTQVLEFMREHDLMAIATVSSDFKPEAAVVGFAVTDNFEIYFGTDNTSRKWTNLQKNSTVALVIGWDKAQTVQYEGDAIEIPKAEHGEIIAKYFAHGSSLAKLLSKNEAAVFKVTPRWIRHTNVSVDPLDTYELPL